MNVGFLSSKKSQDRREREFMNEGFPLGSEENKEQKAGFPSNIREGVDGYIYCKSAALVYGRCNILCT